jgi:tryptophan synthase alpha chain
VSTGAQAREVAQYADGVIVGSAFVRLILGASDGEQARAAVRTLATDLADGVRR